MNKVVHKSETRGYADHGWLKSNHSFSFAGYYEPSRMNFGALRVLNDDQVAPGMGFGTHPHRDMEIISIPLEGDLEHKDSMSNIGVIRQGEIQVMSAGSGVTHSEFNRNKDKDLKFLQIWIMPRENGVDPRYDQIDISDLQVPDQLYQVLSPNKDDQGVWINQDAWFYMGDLSKDTRVTHTLKSAKNGIYVFILEGSIEVVGQEANERDGVGLWNITSADIKAEQDSKILIMEVPMIF